MLDYPDKTACIIWFAGCNMRCSYCYNPDIVCGKGKISFSDALSFIDRRKHLLDGVVLSGGECTMYKDLDAFAVAIRQMGLLIKIDTNGLNPALLKSLIQSQLADYIALDFKAPHSKFRAITRTLQFSKFERSLDILLSSDISFEVRTTIHSELLKQEDLQEMALFLEEKKYGGNYYLQYFINNTATIGALPASHGRIDIGRLNCSVPIIERN